MEKLYLEINFKDLGLIEYKNFLLIQKKLTHSNKNFLLFATHYPVYTVGEKEALNFPFAIPVKRGGSITYFDEGTLMIYFIFNVKNPAIFFKKVRKIMSIFFSQIKKEIYYDKTKPGFYIENRKIASLGFHYEKNRSNHGISIHINPNLKNFNKINPCNLKEIIATSFKNEGINITKNEAKKRLKIIINKVFNET